MGDRTKRRFISDIHMGDERSTKNNYGWFKNNIPKLEAFFAEQLNAPDVKEVVILGDLFDTWVIPADSDALMGYADICSNPDNGPVIEKLKSLASDSCNVKLAYVPGNHDMGMSIAGISMTKDFITTTFPGIRFFCNGLVPWGIYNVGALSAEHGNHYCLFNAPDAWTAKDSFPPLGYFISRMVAYRVSHTGSGGNYYDILIKFLAEIMNHHDIVGDLIAAIANNAGLKPNDTITLSDGHGNKVPGYPATVTIDDVGQRFSKLIQNWVNTPGNCNPVAATVNDLGNLNPAAQLAYFDHFGSNTSIVIFGHTHIPALIPRELNPLDDPANHQPGTPWPYVYANCGAWIDDNKYGCTYVETEEDAGAGRHYVRLKKYPGNSIIREEFVAI
jgi:UDP-2,3-diacylglucosamine pyrophosphatase LpxH